MNKDDKLKTMMESATNSSEDTQKNSSPTGLTKKTKVIIGSSIGAVIVVIAGSLFFIPSFHNKNNFVDMTGENSSAVKGNGIGDFGDVKAPIKLEKWQQSPTKGSVDKKSVMSWANRNPQLYNSLTAGFNANPNLTDNSKNVMVKGKAMNKNYSYLTADNVKYTYTTFVNRLINPIYGNWYLAQFASNNPKSSKVFLQMQDMFTNNWWKNNVSPSNYSAIPVYADWNKSSYDGTKFQKSLARWYGKLVQQRISPITDKKGNFVKIIVDDTVKYSAYSSNGDVITKTGTLHLELVKNNITKGNAKVSPLLIDNAKLTIK